MFKNKSDGFSLLELLITFAIISILISIAYPTYTAHIRKARRKQAQVTLQQLAIKLESHYFTSNNYQKITLPPLNNKHYQYTQQLEKNQFVLQATPIGQQAHDNAICGTLTLTHTGKKSHSGNGSRQQCWQ